MLRVSTRYGYGKYAQVKLVTTAVVNPVVDLKATLVGNTKVHLSWKAPLNTRDIQVRNIEPSSPHVRESGFQNPRNFRFWNPDPTNDWNPESKFHWEKKKNHGPVPKRPISVNPGLTFCSVLVLHFYVLPRVTFCAIIAVSRSKGSTVFCNLELPALKTVLKIWLNPGLDLTIFRGTGTRNPIPRIWDPRRRIQSTRLWWNPLRRATLSPKGNS